MRSCHRPDTILLFLFSHWYNGSHKIKIIPEYYYAKELIFLSTQKFYHTTEKYRILWRPHAFIMFFKGKKKYYSSFNHKHRIIKLAMWMCNFCQKEKEKKTRKHSKSFICFNELQNQILAPNFFLICIHFLIAIFKQSFKKSGQFTSTVQWIFNKPRPFYNR